MIDGNDVGKLSQNLNLFVVDEQGHAVKVNNVSNTYKYNEVSFKKQELADYMKAYLKKLRKHIKKKVSKERLKIFKEHAKTFGLWIFEKFEELQLY